MLDWSNSPPPEASDYGYRLVRTPAYRTLRGICLAHDIVGTRTHFYKSRTKPCLGLDCPECQEGLPWRWHGYLPLLILPSKERVILEITAQAAEQLTALASGYRTLRGLEVTAARPSQKPNGRVVLQARPNGTPPDHLPLEPDVKTILLHIWGLDDQPLRDNGQAKGYTHVIPAPKQPDTLPIHPSANP